MKNKFLLSTVFVFGLIVSACGSSTPMSPTATVATVVPVTGLSTDTRSVAIPTETAMPPATPTSRAVVNVSHDAALGQFLVDVKGLTLYVFSKDSPNTSTCSGSCSNNWPALLTNGAPLGGMGLSGMGMTSSSSMLGTLTRSDGTTQVTYNGWPLYYFAGDKAAGDTNGQGKASSWYVISPAGMPVQTSATPTQGAASSAATVKAGQNATLGSFLVDSKGMTLYLFTQDSTNTSVCYSGCVSYWPPLLTTGAPVPGAGVTASLLGTTTRTDGTTQVTYNGWPLYYYTGDKAAGDTSGENFQTVWFVVTPDGMQK